MNSKVKAAVGEMIRVLHEDRYYGPYRLDYVDESGRPRSALVRDDGSVEELPDLSQRDELLPDPPPIIPLGGGNPVDHRELLRKYIAHVNDCEGIDFIDRIGEPVSYQDFSAEEKAELVRLAS